MVFEPKHEEEGKRRAGESGDSLLNLLKTEEIAKRLNLKPETVRLDRKERLHPDMAWIKGQFVDSDLWIILTIFVDEFDPEAYDW